MSALALTSALLAGSGNVSYTGSDPRNALLTAQALLEHHTFALDAYPDTPSDYHVVERAGHRFYAYPPGTPIAAVPAVAIARLAGLDMARPADDERLQRVLAAISVGLTTVLASLLAARWLPWPLATTLAGILVFGTPVISTMGTAFWSTNLAVLTSLSGLLLLSRPEGSRDGSLRAAATGALLGFGFWCRPPAILLAGLVILWTWGGAVTAPAAGRRAAVARALALSTTVAASVALLIFMSRMTYGTWLPDYYIGARLAASDRFGTAIVAHLVSPSRGLLIYAPAIAIAIVAGVLWPRRVLRAPLATLALLWLAGHLLLVSRFPYWWGGYSFGSRLLVDVLPGVFVFSCAAAAAVCGSARRWRVLGLIALVPLAAAGIWINSAQGLFNTATATWNAFPNIDSFPGYALDWRLPQFWATDARLAERIRRHERWLRPPLEPDVEYTAQSAGLQFLDWSTPESSASSVLRRSAGGTPSIRFLVAEETLRGAERMMLTVCVSAERPLSGQLWLNGRRVSDLAVRGGGPEYLVIGIPRALVRTLEYDVLQTNVLEWRGTRQGGQTPLSIRALRVQGAGRRAS